ncbi:hypothetical protein [Frankia sp. AiPa1]|nr:hypothetical protein [Frankia sp. AiPa1]
MASPAWAVPVAGAAVAGESRAGVVVPALPVGVCPAARPVPA